MPLRYIVKELYHQKRRTVISILGLSIGIAPRFDRLRQSFYFTRAIGGIL